MAAVGISGRCTTVKPGRFHIGTERTGLQIDNSGLNPVKLTVDRLRFVIQAGRQQNIALFFLRFIAFCRSFNPTAATETRIEQTRQRAKATIRTFRLLSLDMTQPPFDVGLEHQLVDQRGKNVGKQNRQHHPSGKAGLTTRIRIHMMPINKP